MELENKLNIVSKPDFVKSIRRLFVTIVLAVVSTALSGCGGDLFDFSQDQVSGKVTKTSGLSVGGARVYLVPLLRMNTTPSGVFTDGYGHYHFNNLDSGYWVMAVSYGTAIAWSQPVYIDEYERDVIIDITSPFVSIESSFSSYNNTAHMIVSSNISHRTNGYTSGLNLITTAGWQEFFPIFNSQGWEFGKMDYNLSNPGEVVFAAGYAGQKDIFRFNMLTGEYYNLTQSDSVDENDPSFRPDGQAIVYSADAYSDVYNSPELWTMDRNGNNRQMLMSDQLYVDTTGDGNANAWVYHSFLMPKWHDRNLTGSYGGSITFSFASELNPGWSIGIASIDRPNMFYQLTNNPDADDFSPQIHPLSTSGGFTIIFSRTEDSGVAGVSETHLYSLYSGNIDGGLATVYEYPVSGFGYGSGSIYGEIYPQFSRYGDYISFVSTDGITDEVFSASYNRGFTSVDSVTNINQWTLSPYGTMYSGPSLLVR